MSTRSLIAMEIPDEKDKYKTIYCHSDGYLTYNGAMLFDHYNDRKRVEKLLDLGNLSCLNEKIEPNPKYPHSFDYDQRQDDVCVAYGRDRGEESQEAQIYNMKELKEEGWIEYVYIFTKDNKWKYMDYPDFKLKDLEDGLNEEYKNLGIEKPENYYGFFTDDILDKIKENQNKTKQKQNNDEMD